MTRPPLAHLYSSKRWVTFAQRFRRDNPLCESCKLWGMNTAGEHLDHISPHEGDLELFWAPLYDHNKGQVLCLACHSSKTAQEKMGRYEDYKNNRTWDVNTSSYDCIRLLPE